MVATVVIRIRGQGVRPDPGAGVWAPLNTGGGGLQHAVMIVTTAEKSFVT